MCVTEVCVGERSVCEREREVRGEGRRVCEREK